MKTSHRSHLALILPVFLFGLAGCGDDSSPTEGGDNLDQAESEVMMEALVEAGGLGIGVIGGGFASPGNLAANVVLDIDETSPCPGGGNVRLVGSATIDDPGENIDWSFTQTHQNCQSTAPSDGSSWTFNGSPSVTTTFSAQIVGEQFSMSGSQQGGVSWSSGGRNGDCQINVNYSFSGVGESFSGSVSGTVCGHSISQSVQVSN